MILTLRPAEAWWNSYAQTLLRAFLGLPVPAEPFPRSNSAEEFWADSTRDRLK